MSDKTDDMEQDAAFALAEMHRLRTALQKAERERDEADKRALTMCAVQEAEMQARIRAEAYNAALLRAGHWLVHERDGYHPMNCRCAECERARHAFKQEHPGAAMLERLRALESRVTMASAELRHAYKVKQDWELVARAIRMLEAVATPNADALKGETCAECGMVGTHKLQCGRRA